MGNRIVTIRQFPNYRLSVSWGLLKNKQVGSCLGLECHLNFVLLLLLSGVHSMEDSGCAVGRTKSVLSNKKFFSSRATDKGCGSRCSRVISKSGL